MKNEKVTKNEQLSAEKAKEAGRIREAKINERLIEALRIKKSKE